VIPVRHPGDIERLFREVERSPNTHISDLGENVPVISFQQFDTKTGGRLDALDITGEVRDVVADSGVQHGTALVFSPHTTCCVLIATPNGGMIEALDRAMAKIAPHDGYYMHDDLKIRTENLTENEPANAPAHIAHAFIGKASETIPVADGRLVLGPGQRVLFVELDSSRERRYCIQVVGE
jgi:secondary thiamine-phosphate synthase enzyme